MRSSSWCGPRRLSRVRSPVFSGSTPCAAITGAGASPCGGLTRGPAHAAQASAIRNAVRRAPIARPAADRSLLLEVIGRVVRALANVIDGIVDLVRCRFLTAVLRGVDCFVDLFAHALERPLLLARCEAEYERRCERSEPERIRMLHVCSHSTAMCVHRQKNVHVYAKFPRADV